MNRRLTETVEDRHARRSTPLAPNHTPPFNRRRTEAPPPLPRRS
nr:MAG TPA: hypothetical protein [Caudoviricetes sp.]